DVSDLVGQVAQLQFVDSATSGQGSILVDDITFSDEPALSGQHRTDWLDWGRDWYASITFDNVPDDRRLLVGWMSNWIYTNQVPTSPWRSAQSEPRELSLRDVGDGKLQVFQKPVDELNVLRHSPYEQSGVVLDDTPAT